MQELDETTKLQARINGLTLTNEALEAELRATQRTAAQAVLALVETRAVLDNILNLPAFRAVQEGGYFKQMER